MDSRLLRLVVLITWPTLFSSCGPDTAPAPEIPPWAHVAPEQIAEAKKHGVPVAFENDLGMRFVLIPAGTFLMGSPEDEEGNWGYETLHKVTLTKPYYMQTMEMTNEDYRRFRLDHCGGQYKGRTRDNDSQPVCGLHWEHAIAFAVWLSGREGGREYELPTEAQWEYACRAGTTERFWWGSSEADAHRYANGADPKTKSELGLRGDVFPHDDGYRLSAPVGSYEPNGWGLYDMLGNVAEWCLDLGGTYEGGDQTDPNGPDENPCGDRVRRGGSWVLGPRNVRCAERMELPQFGTGPTAGFRLASPLLVSEGDEDDSSLAGVYRFMSMPDREEERRDADSDLVWMIWASEQMLDTAHLTLRKNGIFVFDDGHPFDRILGLSAGGWERVVDRLILRPDPFALGSLDAPDALTDAEGLPIRNGDLYIWEGVDPGISPLVLRKQ